MAAVVESGRNVHADAGQPRGFLDSYGVWLLVGVLVAAVAGGIPVAVDLSRQTPEEVFQSLAETPFSEDLPGGRHFNYRTESSLGGSGKHVGEATFGHLVSTQAVTGGVLLVTYIVEATEDEANIALHKARLDAVKWNEHLRFTEEESPRRAARDYGGPYRIEEVPDLGHRNVCLHSEAGAWVLRNSRNCFGLRGISP